MDIQEGLCVNSESGLKRTEVNSLSSRRRDYTCFKNGKLFLKKIRKDKVVGTD